MSNATSSAPDQRAIPDRMSIEQGNAHFDLYHKKVGVKFDGRVLFDVAEYCVSEGWVRRIVKDWKGGWKQERGKLVTTMHLGKVEPYWR